MLAWEVHIVYISHSRTVRFKTYGELLIALGDLDSESVTRINILCIG